MTVVGLLLLLVGISVVLVEAHRPAHGFLVAPGVALLAGGAVLAVSGLGGGVVTGAVVAVVLAAVGVSVVAVSLRKGSAVRRRRIRTGAEGMIGRLGVVTSWSELSGKVLVDGALWRARVSPGADEDENPPARGEQIVIDYVDGLTLAVRRAEEWELMRW